MDVTSSANWSAVAAWPKCTWRSIRALGVPVAVKIMRADFANDKIFLERFRREAHSVAQMNNPNIVNIYDSGEEVVATETGQTEHLPYLVMEYVKGQTLARHSQSEWRSEPARRRTGDDGRAQRA